MKHAIRCEGSPKIFGLSVLPYDVLPGLPNRTDGKLHFPAILVIDGFKAIDIYYISLSNFHQYCFLRMLAREYWKASVS